MTADVVTSDGRVISGAELDAMFEAAEAEYGDAELATGEDIHAFLAQLRQATMATIIGLDSARQAKLDRLAAARHSDIVQVIRDLIDAA
ncbi:MAG: hypothetical protein FWD83_00795 [Promicromonosporaceae bacterium]|nr:hypothetical protein [Promicromonosporaceae bacterium]